ncbi:DNA replication licensing factor MCM2 [Nematocida homosporus]|uniref:DNA replication licensing factor MCM2 n=1 Tax=Nematocida homosporus TaxID=1912981 RepID=UPI00221E62F3|nr:DNA replication licensing factor MCM2 [Nematocida homosporus]KAI5186278.1 DNA replication licensing factor MCM2 [Nematocida homosporus]
MHTGQNGSSFSSDEDLDQISLVDSKDSKEDLGDEDDLEGSGEDLFGDSYAKDYASNTRLDRYETEEEEESEGPLRPLTAQEMAAAEQDIAQMFHTHEGHSNWGSNWGSNMGLASVGHSEDLEEDSSHSSLNSFEYSPLDSFELLQAHIHALEIQERVKKEMEQFLKTFGDKKYLDLINQMASLNMQSLYVDYFDLESYSGVLAQAALAIPTKILPLLNQALHTVVRGLFPRYSQIKHVLLCRLTNIPAYDQIRDLRNVHLNSLVKVAGIITKRSRVFPMLSLVKYTCQKCRALLGPFLVENEAVKPNRCLECQSLGPFQVNTAETIYKDFQKLSIQEIPGTIPAGRLPRSKDLILQYDLIDQVKPGDEVEVIGIYKNNFTNGGTSSAPLKASVGNLLFFTSIEVLSLQKRGDDFSLLAITAEDEREIQQLAKHPDVFNMIVASIAPSIHGLVEAKRAIALSIFGGVSKQNPGHKTRGDINMLLLGDPGMAKSQLLKYVEKIAHRAVFATGQGASAVGLTAMVRKDPASGEWTLEGGALVLADKGVCLIDEFDKMKDTDRVSIHEAMEQQSISISKAGIVTSLQARCAVIAAANPVRGKYNPAYTFAQNVNLSDPIISRFDIICLLKDEASPSYDRELASFIISSHNHNQNSHLSQNQNQKTTSIISQDLLRKYVAYARERVHPQSSPLDAERIASLYATLRKESNVPGSVPITVRHIESIVRISEAAARIHLRDYVTKSDIDLAIRVALDSFCGTQKTAVRRALLKKLAKYLPEAPDDFQFIKSLLVRLLDKAQENNQNSVLSQNQNQNTNPNQSISLQTFKSRAKSLGLKYKTFLSSPEFTQFFQLSKCGQFISQLPPPAQ